MCQSHLYAEVEGGRELLFDEVAGVEVDGERLTIRPLIGEPVTLTARIRRIDLMKHEITVRQSDS